MVWRKTFLAEEFFYHFPAGREFLHLEELVTFEYYFAVQVQLTSTQHRKIKASQLLFLRIKIKYETLTKSQNLRWSKFFHRTALIVGS